VSEHRNFVCKKSLVLAITCGLFSVTINAQDNNTAHSGGWGFSGYVDSQSIDSNVAEEQGIGDSATVVGFAGERYTSANNRTFNIGMDIFIYDDKAGFSQTTKNTSTGSVQDSDSSARGFTLYADYGPRYKFGSNESSFFTVRGGMNLMLSSERSIGNCTDCSSQDIDVDGGIYGLAGIGHSFGSVSIGLQVKQYLSGDLGTGFGIKLSSSY
jgi:hypothetical protein